MKPYACPNCRNKMRFHLIDQHPVSVKLDPATGEITEHVSPDDLMSQPYKGETRLVQCAICGTNGGSLLFEKAAQRYL
ncbi:MAG: hypothetical protein ACXVP2_06945 [Tumebacillaceae bacterium]